MFHLLVRVISTPVVFVRVIEWKLTQNTSDERRWIMGTIYENANGSGISMGDSSSEFQGPADSLISQFTELVFNVQRFNVHVVSILRRDVRQLVAMTNDGILNSNPLVSDPG